MENLNNLYCSSGRLHNIPKDHITKEGLSTIKYIVRNVESHSMHTKLELYGENGKFNSVHFNIK